MRKPAFETEFQLEDLSQLHNTNLFLGGALRADNMPPDMRRQVLAYAAENRNRERSGGYNTPFEGHRAMVMARSASSRFTGNRLSQTDIEKKLDMHDNEVGETNI